MMGTAANERPECFWRADLLEAAINLVATIRRTRPQVVVTYDDGVPEKLDVKENLAAGAETRVIDLHGGKRSIRIIEFWYETKNNKGDKAEVVAFGQH